jgi:hypothetical protein
MRDQILDRALVGGVPIHQFELWEHFLDSSGEIFTCFPKNLPEYKRRDQLGARRCGETSLFQ